MTKILKAYTWTEEIIKCYFYNSKHIIRIPLSELHKIQVQNKTIVVCESGDFTLNQYCCLPSTIKKVYTTNCNVLPNNIYYGIPYGVFGVQYIIPENTNKTKKYLCYANFATHTHSSRKNIWSYCQSQDFIFCNRPSGDQSKVKNQITANHTFISELSTSHFAICPRGNGIDTYRFWECLYCNTIPIVEQCPMVEHFKYKLPIVVVKSFNEVTELFLLNKLNEIKNQKHNLEILTPEYYISQWRRDIEEIKNEI